MKMNEHQTLMMEYYELWGKMDDVYDHWAKARVFHIQSCCFFILCGKQIGP